MLYVAILVSLLGATPWALAAEDGAANDGAAKTDAAAIEGLGSARHACVTELPRVEAALAKSPRDRQLRLDRALCLHAVGRYDQALDALDEALSGARLPADLATWRDLEEALVVKAVLLAWRGRPEQAQTAVTAVRSALGARHPGALRAAAMAEAGAGGVEQAWAQAGRAAKLHPDHPHTTALLAELTALDPDAAPDWARQVLGRSARVLSKTNKAVALLTGRRFDLCVEVVAETLGQAEDAQETRRLRVLGHRCAAHGGDLSQANEHLMALRDLSILDGQAVLAHADLMAQAGRVTDAVRMVELARVDDLRGADTRLVRWSLELGRLDAAWEAGRRGHASPESRATLGLALHKAGRSEDAEAVLSEACPELTRGAQHDCDALLKRVGRK